MLVQKQMAQQIIRLMRAKRDALRQAEQKLHPSADACQTDMDKGVYIERNVIANAFGDSVLETLSWEENTSCSQLYLEYAEITSYDHQAPHPDYWERVRYGGLDRGEGCPFIGTNYLDDNIRSWQQVNYTFEFWVNNSSGCGYGSSHSFVDISVS